MCCGETQEAWRGAARHLPVASRAQGPLGPTTQVWSPHNTSVVSPQKVYFSKKHAITSALEPENTPNPTFHITMISKFY